MTHGLTVDASPVSASRRRRGVAPQPDWYSVHAGRAHAMRRVSTLWHGGVS